MESFKSSLLSLLSFRYIVSFSLHENSELVSPCGTFRLAYLFISNIFRMRMVHHPGLLASFFFNRQDSYFYLSFFHSSLKY